MLLIRNIIKLFSLRLLKIYIISKINTIHCGDLLLLLMTIQRNNKTILYNIYIYIFIIKVIVIL